MAGSSYHYGWQHNHQQQQQQEEGTPLPLHLCFFLVIIFLFITLSWYLSYESALEALVDQLKLVLVLSPLVLLLAVHWLSSAEPGRLPLLLPLPDQESLHRAGGSPWGVALVLLLLLVMVSYQSSFHERWFPMLGR